ncbi:polyprenyl diphosphate synthase [Streptomyces vinaceus]|uniref:polyprenyl diphosphate synthase n=1 Tax=Streptomyces vinaceus TaxID=1960 RepID=UPI003698C4C6
MTLAETPALRHLAVILDGNRRWASAHGRPLAEVYQLGATRVRHLLEWCDEAGVQYATVWALSQDNMRRNPEEVATVVDAVINGLSDIAAARRWPIRPLGALDQLPARCAAQLRAFEADTAGARGTTLNVAVAYSGRDDITQAVRTLVYRHGGENLDTATTELLLSRYLSTAGQPDPDLVIRTSGEQRLSGFMLWQTAQAELYFSPTPWPDFDHDAFTEALRWYTHRTRRHGL